MTTHYEVLGLDPGADDDIIKAAYRVTVKKLHPDRGGDPHQMALANHAYDVLSDPERRRAYDRDLAATVFGAGAGQHAAATPDDFVDISDHFTDAAWDAPGAYSDTETSTQSSDPFADSPWSDAPGPQTAAESPRTSSPQDVPFLAVIGGFLGGALLAVTLLASAGTIVIGGVMKHSGWLEIVLNLALLILVAGATAGSISRRMRRYTFLPLGRFYATALAAPALFGAATGGLLGLLCITWSLAVAMFAESTRVSEKRHPVWTA